MARLIKTSATVSKYTNAEIEKIRKRNETETNQLARDAVEVAGKLKNAIDQIVDDKLRKSASTS